MAFKFVPIALALLVAGAGCFGGGSEGSGTGTTTTTGSAGANGNNDTFQQAPEWKVGQQWKHDWKIGTTTSFSVNAIVVENTSSEYVVATDVLANAAFASAFFFMDIGRMSKADWSMRDQGFQFPWYRFPLTDGLTWNAPETNLDTNLNPIDRQLDLTATAVGKGRFMINVTSNGQPRAMYDYDPALGWFSTFESYSQNATGVTRTDLTIQASALPNAFAGTYYQATSDMVLNTIHVIAPAGGQVVGQPAHSFDVKAAATHVLGIMFNFAAPGASTSQLFASVVGDQTGAALAGVTGTQILEPSAAGTWRFATGGAGGFAWGGGAFVWAVTMTNATL
jgi:hypothetical protein